MDLSKLSLEEFAGFVSSTLRKEGIQTVLVGGACVTIYSKERYLSYDLDFATHEDIKTVEKVLKGLGFKIEGKYFRHPDSKWVVEFVATPIAVGEEHLQNFDIHETPLGQIQLLKPIDCIKDRLASYYHWDDEESLEQAIQVYSETHVDLEELKQWSKKEGQMKKYKTFTSKIKKRAP